MELIDRLFGAALIAPGLLAWAIRNTADAGVRCAVLPALLVGETLGFVLIPYRQVDAVLNPFGWLAVATCLLRATGLACFSLNRPAAA